MATRSIDRRSCSHLGKTCSSPCSPAFPFDLFDKGIALMRRNPSIAVSPQSIMYALLYSLCESCERVVDFISDVLDNMSEETDVACAGQDKTGKIITEGTAQEVVSCLGRCEGVLSRTQESLLKINRAARHLRSDIEGDLSLRERVDLLASDLNVVRDHASFEQDKVRFLQSSIMTALQPKAKRHRQGVHHHHSGVPAAHAHRDVLRHELHLHARASSSRRGSSSRRASRFWPRSSPWCTSERWGWLR